MSEYKKNRRDFQELLDRKEWLKDENRPSATGKRKKKNQRTARENIADLCDGSSFKEIGSLIVAAQRGRKSNEELMRETPCDGLIAGFGNINSDHFDDKQTGCYILAYDYTVLAGTQGAFNHKKTDRMLQMVNKIPKPVIFFVEGGGGRPGDVDYNPITTGWLDLNTFVEYARLSGKIPRLAIVSGYCFAGNASLAGCSDVIIATKNTSMGMGGPAMIEGGGLGNFHPTEIGPPRVMNENGVVDILVEDEKEAVSTAKKYLSYFQGNLGTWSHGDQEVLRRSIPEDRRYAYDIQKVIKVLFDKDSSLELRSGFAKNAYTGLARVAGIPVGVMANSTRYLGGAIDSDAADKFSRFMQLCDAFGLPLVSLVDAPGFMVGPDIEKSGMVRHANRMFVVGASLKVPVFTVVLRKSYGLGAMAMAGGSLHASYCTIAWPSAEFGAMGLEGSVKLGFRKELESTGSREEKDRLFNDLLKSAYNKGKAVNAAQMLEFDEVIDPMDTREWIITAIKSTKFEKNQRMIDTW